MKSSKERYLLGQNTTCAIVRGNPLSSYKTTVKRWREKKRWKIRSKAKPLICFWLSYVVFLSNAWKNAGTIMACNRCDVMNIRWRKTQTVFVPSQLRHASRTGGTAWSLSHTMLSMMAILSWGRNRSVWRVIRLFIHGKGSRSPAMEAGSPQVSCVYFCRLHRNHAEPWMWLHCLQQLTKYCAPSLIINRGTFVKNKRGYMYYPVPSKPCGFRER